MKKKILFICGIVTVVLISIISIFVGMQDERKASGITRYEWIRMLTEEFGISEYAEENSYFDDVAQDNTYFSCVQSACEWGIIDNKTDFKGDSPVTGYYVALTSMKAIGQHKVQIYLSGPGKISTYDYLKVAIQEDVIELEQLFKSFSEVDCNSVLERASELYVGGLWKDDVCEVEFQENVVQIFSENIVAMNSDCSQIRVAGELANSLDAGDIVVLEHPMTKQKFAKEILDIGADNMLSVADAELKQTVDSILVSDITTVSIVDILEYYQLSEREASSAARFIPTAVNPNNYVAEPVFSLNTHDKGFSITLKTDDSDLGVELTDHNTGLTYVLPIQEDLEEGSNVNATVDISRIDVGAQVIYTSEEGLSYANAQVESDITFSGDISISEEKKIPLFDSPVLLGSALVGVDLKFYLVLSVDGSISIQTELPFRLSVDYVKGVGVRSRSGNLAFQDPTIYADCTAGCFLRTEAILKVLMLNVLDVEGDVGATASADFVSRNDSNVLTCMDISIAAPVFTVYLSGDDDITTMLNLLDVSGEWDIVDSDNALFKRALHYEWYLDGSNMSVGECTYGTNELVESSQLLENLLFKNGRFVVYFTSDFADKGSYYIATGTVLGSDYIHPDTLEKLQVGDIYTVNGKKLIYEGIISYDEIMEQISGTTTELKADIEFCRFSDDSNKVYYTFAPSQTIVIPTAYLGNEYYHKIFKPINVDGPSLISSISLIEEGYTLIIPKDTEVFREANSSFENAPTYFETETYTVEETINEEILTYWGDTLADAEGVWGEIVFGDNGYVEQIEILDDYHKYDDYFLDALY